MYLSLTVGDIDVNRYSTGGNGNDVERGKGNDVKRGKIWLKKLVLFKGRRPGKLGEEIFCRALQFTELLSHDLVNHSHETLHMCTMISKQQQRQHIDVGEYGLYFLYCNGTFFKKVVRKPKTKRSSSHLKDHMCAYWQHL